MITITTLIKYKQSGVSGVKMSATADPIILKNVDFWV